MDNFMIEEGLDFNVNFEEAIKEYSKLLKQYKYNAEGFYITSMVVENDSVNSSFHNVKNAIVCIPREFKDRAVKITCNFTCDKIQLLDRSYNVLLTTCGTGYDDIETPRFFIGA